jgi:hypothetical protein
MGGEGTVARRRPSLGNLAQVGGEPRKATAHDHVECARLHIVAKDGAEHVKPDATLYVRPLPDDKVGGAVR